MKEISSFLFKPQPGPYETWSLCSELIMDGKRTGKYVPGFVIGAQYAYKDLYLIVTSWDCSYEESQEFILLSNDLTVLCKKHIGHIYSTILLEGHEPVAEDQVLFHCNDDIDILVTAKSGLLHSSPPFFTTQKIRREIATAV
ncbi:MAG: hypothetical protein OEQ24_04785 [Gammaproteobacteria bacterium]|nr:hypothetical protein [Gammaproteobacteria bacterium]